MTDKDNVTQLGNRLRDALIRMDKDQCVQLTLDALESGAVTLEELYEEILAPALNDVTEQENPDRAYVWKEHVRSGIVRTCIENCAPYVAQRAKAAKEKASLGTVVVASPSDEQHELGARMGVDFFRICGYDTVFLGSDTPREALLDGVWELKPDLVVLNVVNYYNLFKVKDVLTDLSSGGNVPSIYLCGRAIRNNPELLQQIGAAGVLSSIGDIRALAGKEDAQ